MRIARYAQAGVTGWGLVEDDQVTNDRVANDRVTNDWVANDRVTNYRVIPLPGATDFAQALAAARNGNLQGRGATLPAAGLQLLPPVLPDTKIICVGLNYRKHAQEVARDSGGHPSVFPRFPDTFVGHGEPVLRSPVSAELDYEAELAVVIGKPARYVDEADAMDYVGGYTCMAENSVRDYQMHNRQATPGKNFLRSGALGPWIVTPDVMPALASVRVAGRLNGEQVQDATLDDLVFSIPQLISYLSQFTLLRPGDIIATGTPEGVGMSRKPPRYLRAGDRFEVEIAGIGVLANPVQDEGAGHA
ncbi:MULTISPECIES: fumarylacetoacetate hydrolase family protein [unclassified Achromobacter]|uniref:fumarylacetoacetate hydrolase family protein n=1 Tax=unclassified Achromobacter TaxID=2626865 RepID=UPI000B5177C1|nr:MULTISPECIES: fumarylacetoacetate hydrolase family protein [unclassified Achromobacter]OWT76911.1 5-carboxymethyl-2-hydroxymuconate isomerase [Achromobacter sp. HZ28]OWT77791.1 5-carboxymethyl-2-hydroxymuconate isomerase [Achromobacter sp. HZ34]